MKGYIKTGLRIFGSYVTVLLLFVVFLYPYMAITKDNFLTWLPLYSFLTFLLLFYMIYGDMKTTAAKEKKPQYGFTSFPVKGLYYGLAGFAPIIVLEAVYPLIRLQGDIAVRIKELALNTLLGPLYFVVKLAGGTVLAYAAASLVIPLLAMAGYMAGYYGLGLKNAVKNDKRPAEQKFEKSPWNPSVPQAKSSKKSGAGVKKPR